MAEIKKVIRNWTTYDIFNSDNVDSALNTSSTNAIQNWAVATALDTKITNPSGWTTGQVLTKTAQWEEWDDVEALPSWWSTWDKLQKTADWAEWVDWELVEIKADDYSALQWPAPDGFHVPLTTEWQWLKTIMDWLSLTTWDGWRINLHMPFAGYRYNSTAGIWERGSCGEYWSSSPSASSLPGRARFLHLISSQVYNWDTSRSGVYSVRCFKNSFELPTASWTIITWTLWSAWIFWNQSKWLISITNWTTWYTIQDKNLWATTVYNDGDTLTQANMWNMYQWWNNYWFPSTDTISNTSSTKVDASTYWPWNYYSSSTFIKTWDADWSSVQNDNLRWWVTWILNSKYAWWEKFAEVPSIWAVWQVLTKQSNWYSFVNPDYLESLRKLIVWGWTEIVNKSFSQALNSWNQSASIEYWYKDMSWYNFIFIYCDAIMDWQECWFSSIIPIKNSDIPIMNWQNFREYWWSSILKNIRNQSWLAISWGLGRGNNANSAVYVSVYIKWYLTTGYTVTWNIKIVWY